MQCAFQPFWRSLFPPDAKKCVHIFKLEFPASQTVISTLPLPFFASLAHFSPDERFTSPSMAEEEKGRANGNVERGAGLDMVRNPTNTVFQTTFTISMFHIITHTTWKTMVSIRSI